MSRAVLALAVGGVLFVATAACGTAANAPSAVSTVSSEQAAALADTRKVCEALGQVYGKNIGPFATTVGKLISSRTGSGDTKTPQAQAQQELRTFAADVRTTTSTSTDPQMRADGEQTAKQLTDAAADKTTFDKVKTSQDLQTLMGPTLTQWLQPINSHCS
jgi:hypothetical protein